MDEMLEEYGLMETLLMLAELLEQQAHSGQADNEKALLMDAQKVRRLADRVGSS